MRDLWPVPEVVGSAFSGCLVSSAIFLVHEVLHMFLQSLDHLLMFRCLRVDFSATVRHQPLMTCPNPITAMSTCRAAAYCASFRHRKMSGSGSGSRAAALRRPERDSTKPSRPIRHLPSGLTAYQKPGGWLSHHVNAIRIAVCAGNLRQTCEYYMLNKAIPGWIVMIRSIGMSAGSPGIQVKRSHRREA